MAYYARFFGAEILFQNVHARFLPHCKDFKKSPKNDGAIRQKVDCSNCSCEIFLCPSLTGDHLLWKLLYVSPTVRVAERAEARIFQGGEVV